MLEVVTLFVMAYVAQSQKCIGQAAHDSSCTTGIQGPLKGSAMLQVQRLSTRTASSCSIERAKRAPLTEGGFAQVSKTCCYEDVQAFMNRVIDGMGLKVCDEGLLSGMARFYSCPPSPPTLVELRAELNDALPTESSRCHWLAKRDQQCTAPALECAVSMTKPPPYPKPVASGFMAFKATNPAEMMKSSRARHVMQHDIAVAIGVDTRYVNVVISSSPLNEQEVMTSVSVLHIPESRAFFKLHANNEKNKVFAAFSIQGDKPKDRYSAAPVSNLDEAVVLTGLKHLDTPKLAARLSTDLASADTLLGPVEVLDILFFQGVFGH